MGPPSQLGARWLGLTRAAGIAGAKLTQMRADHEATGDRPSSRQRSVRRNSWIEAAERIGAARPLADLPTRVRLTLGSVITKRCDLGALRSLARHKFIRVGTNPDPLYLDCAPSLRQPSRVSLDQRTYDTRYMPVLAVVSR
jgi:hypothetical protein